MEFRSAGRSRPSSSAGRSRPSSSAGILLVASPGGHLDELWEIARRYRYPRSKRLWVTARTAQSESLLRGEPVYWCRPVGPRQLARAAGTVPDALRLFRTVRPEMVLSTGAALAAPYLLAAGVFRVPIHFVESATRLNGPSLTGMTAAVLPGSVLEHQGFLRAHRGWDRTASLFDDYLPISRPPGDLRRAVVTLGTERFPFHRAVSALSQTLPAEAAVLWQLGSTQPPPQDQLTGTVRHWMPADELASAMAAADLVVTHAGVGSVLTAMRAGRFPVVLARSGRRGEHVDEHQAELARSLAARGLITVGDPDDLTQLGEAIRIANRFAVKARRVLAVGAAD